MARIRTSVALLVLGTALAGCEHGIGPSKAELEVNRSLYSENQPVVEHSYFALDLASAGDGISSGERARLADWFDTLELRYGDRISVDSAYASPGAVADVARITADYGLMLSDGVPPTLGSAQPGTVRVVVSRATASVPGCPNWRQAKLSGAPISTESNFGCATNSNLAAMIANPDDLILGQQGTPSGDANLATKAIKAYRDKTPTGSGGLEKVSTTGGN
ncbi:MAG TPA: CpaD family pilus assembly lipoprotein [Allosphingosinicella sp.]|nr:CpaD family pilus assembly lipoprotein [Allosphingosinicella sp.]